MDVLLIGIEALIGYPLRSPVPLLWHSGADGHAVERGPCSSLEANRGWREVFVPPLHPLHHPPVYRIEGYIDRVPNGTKVIDRIQISARNEPTRTLLVTVYKTPSEAGLDRYLSREMMSPFELMGNPDDVSYLLHAPAGTAVEGTFVLYTQGPPALMIASLDSPRR